jgi:hypothetical protein
MLIHLWGKLGAAETSISRDPGDQVYFQEFTSIQRNPLHALVEKKNTIVSTYE